ncbi:nuclear condensing complex subunit [Rhodocollybia butyracea]|uniref:Nuclear condensing complex subunit n=1 Tax=Rhodocollybia butyracea TaxID=206335 RepID=A0A9P5PMQ1_9AGAR|nr:nuclear condensing complex subunit [Rhodocollybia butyracea]
MEIFKRVHVLEVCWLIRNSLVYSGLFTSHLSTASPSLPMPAKSHFSLDELSTSVSAKFDQAQSSLANHRKNCVELHKLHLQASKIKDTRQKDEKILIGEEAFGDCFIDMVNRTLAMKKGAFADRIVKFIGSYVKMMNDKLAEDHSDNAEETFASRFVTRLLEWLFPGFRAKNKMVRQRSIQLVTEMMANIGEIDESTYNQLRDSLIERLCDKEPLIRAHAAIALSKLVGTEDPTEMRHGEKTCLDLLLECTQYDTAPEVRRAALVNLPVTPETLAVIITRTRDTDTLTRKLAYSAVLEPKLAHPRHLTIAQREEITKAGLGDREAVVRVAAGKMITKWLDIAMGEPDPQGQPPQTWEGDDGGVMRGFISFLAFFDVVGPGEAIAVDAMLSVFTTRPALLDVFVFNDDFWGDLSPESAVLARIFVEQCLETKNENLLEAASIPVVTAFAFHIQEAYNALLALMQEMDFVNVGEPDDEESEAREEELAKKELILGELLRIALKLDYGDEIGRRKVFSVVRDMLAHPFLPPGLIERCLDVLSKILPSERELIRIVVEIIIELRDDDGDPTFDENFDPNRSDLTQTTNASNGKKRSMQRSKGRDDMTPEEQQEVDMTDMRCLVLCIGMLERVNGTFEDNSTLEGVLTDLIVPAVKRKELVLREKGLVALGLCCLIARNLATNSFQLFLNQVQTAPEDLKLKVLQIVFDLLIMYDHEFLGRSKEISAQIISFILQILESEESPAIQSVLCIGICKFLLSGQVTDSKVLLSLVLTYISPSTMDNSELKQCLSYFFPVYCYSSRANQTRMQSIFIEAYDLASRVYEDLDDEQKEDPRMISLHQFGLLMIDWTDMTKLVDKVPPAQPTDRNPHADLAVTILLTLYDSERDDLARKSLCQFLGQLQFFSAAKEVGLDNRILLKLNVLVENLQEQCPLEDVSLDRTFNRVKDRFRKTFAKRLERIDPGRYVDEEFEKFYEDIGMEVPDATGPPIEEESVQDVEAAAEGVEEEPEPEPEEEEPEPDDGSQVDQEDVAETPENPAVEETEEKEEEESDAEDLPEPKEKEKINKV